MATLVRCAAIVYLVWCLGCGMAQAGDCRQRALDQLKASSPEGFAIYSQISQPVFFERWIDCHDPQFDLSTAVHESTHFITAETDAFPLIGGGVIARPHAVSDFFAPSRIADRFRNDDFAAIYLRRGKASSSTDLLYLLDELNAYAHDLETAVALKHLSAPDEAVDHRDGLAALMAFLAIYVETAKESEPATWAGLRQPGVAQAISTLWGQAERVMAASCGIPNFGTADKTYIRQYCRPAAQTALGPILGRQPLCPSACLQPMHEGGSTGEDGLPASSSRVTLETLAEEPLTTVRPHHPFNIQGGARRHRQRAAAN